jgi:hypothetical protein
MFTFQGIAVDSYVMFERECTVTCRVNGPEIEVVLGHAAGSLHLVTNEAGLDMLVPLLSEAHARIHATPADVSPQFTIPPTA